jgi:hypothetical protein
VHVAAPAQRHLFHHQALAVDGVGLPIDAARLVLGEGNLGEHVRIEFRHVAAGQAGALGAKHQVAAEVVRDRVGMRPRQDAGGFVAQHGQPQRRLALGKVFSVR